MDHEEERNFFFFLFTSLLFKDQRENNSVIPLRGYTLGNNIVVVQRDTAHPKILSWASHILRRWF